MVDRGVYSAATTRKEIVVSRAKLSDIATAASVSLSAASFALNDRPGVSDSTRQRVLEAAARLGYHPSSAAATLRTGKSKTFGLLMRNLGNPFFLDVVQGFEETCSAAGFSIVLGSSDYKVAREQAQIEMLASRGVDGLVIAPIGRSGGPQLWSKLTGRPLVLLNAASYVAPKTVARVHADNDQAIALAVDHLANLGHAKIAFLTAPKRIAADPERLVAFNRLCEESGLCPLVIESMPSLVASTQALMAALTGPKKQRPTAVMTNSDQLALAAYVAASQLGIRIPDDVSVVGHDDLPTSAFLSPSLTTVAVNRKSLGQAAAEFLVRAIDSDAAEGQKKQVHIEPVSLVVRQSTRHSSDRTTGQGILQ
jgi:DNA-binding LacI/PurR family transcriptional regulator